MDFVNAFILAVIEGITEFLPISSTGHLILVGEYLGFNDGEDFAKAFDVIIQLPAILAVVIYFWGKLWPFGKGKDTAGIFTLWFKVAAAFVPAGFFGLVYSKLDLEEVLFKGIVVALALAVGGVVLIVLERRERTVKCATVAEIGWMVAVYIGLCQCLGMIPGVSRAAATIIGAMLLGASRPAAAEFSFFLAIPTMLGATAVTLLKHGVAFTGHQWMVLALGCVVSFGMAYGAIAFLMRFIQRNRFTAFGWYRVVLGGIVLALWALGR